MTRRISPQAIMATGAALSLALVLSACEPTAEDDADQDPGGSSNSGVSAEEVEAPDPTGNQHSHDQMREALEETIEDASISDTDDLWGSRRDISRELQMLHVDPADCKSFVTASAELVPSGALMAIAEHSQRQTTIYSFGGTDETQAYVTQEQDGVTQCDEHTVTRELDDDDLTVESALTEIEVSSEAQEALAVASELESEEETEHLVTVLLLHESTVVSTAETLDESLEESEAEQLATELEAGAAAVLSEVTGEDVISAESEEDSEDDGEDDD